MPKFLETYLETAAHRKGFTGRRAARYVFGAMNNLGAMHGNQETAKGRAMDRKHARDERAGVAEAQIRRAPKAKRRSLEAKKRRVDR